MPLFSGARRTITNSISSSNNNNNNNRRNNNAKLSTFIVYGMMGLMVVYMGIMITLTRYTTTLSSSPTNNNPKEDDVPIPGGDGGAGAPEHHLNNPHKKVNPNYTPHIYTREEWGDRGGNKPQKEWGEGVQPEIMVPAHQQQQQQQRQHLEQQREQPSDSSSTHHNHHNDRRVIMTAYLEPMDPNFTTTKPLPIRHAQPNDLKKIEFPQVTSCQSLLEQLPVDEYPDDDPYLPWIHDVFPTHDGKYIQFVAQNKERCHTGTTQAEKDIIQHMQPQVSLFQHVAVKRVNDDANNDKGESTRYQLTNHDEADPDGMETRFICQFSSGHETLSRHNFSYEFASTRKRLRKMFHPDGRDNKLIHTSQLTFVCPVPQELQNKVKSGETVVDDKPTLFVNIIPIRTPVRYGSPKDFLPPYYQAFASSGGFNVAEEYGTNHILPPIPNAGRWENIPICQPSLMTYEPQATIIQHQRNGNEDEAEEEEDPAVVATASAAAAPFVGITPAQQKSHRLVSCLWASTGYATRGNRFAINDGQRRLLEWITYNKLIGVEHFYLYDNSGAFGNTNGGLQPIADLFPNDVTLIQWPSRVCNNNPNNVDSCGERSSQYAAEASCRLRFGPHTDWIAQFDIDEYLVPMGNWTSIHPLLERLDEEKNKIVSFGSWRAWPRRRFIETPVRMHGAQNCGRNQDCFQLHIPMNYTMLQAYNCDRQKPGEKEKKMPAEKQIYRPDYVLHHFIHYSTVTAYSILNKEDAMKQFGTWKEYPFPDPYSRFGDETTEGLMLHTKAVATQDTIFWEKACNASLNQDDKALCRLGTPFPENMTGVDITKGDEGWKFNCYVNHKIDDYWVKRLEADLKQHVPEIANRPPITWA